VAGCSASLLTLPPGSLFRKGLDGRKVWRMGLRGGAEGLLEDEEEALVAKMSKMGHGDNSKGNVNMVMVGHVDAGKSTISGYVCK